MVAKVEPLVSMGQITKATCPMNLSLAVAPEFDDLTVGGLINNYGISGGPHIYGLFSDTVVAMEVVLADGQVVRATQDNEDSDLFYGMPWSQGTIGLLVSAEIKLIPIKEYMRLTYTPVRGTLKEIAEAYADSFVSRDGDPAKIPDFVQGMVYSSSEGVMMTGVYASEEEAKKKGNKINRVGCWFKPWFYQYAETFLKRGEFVEYIPTREYYHRHTRSPYWEGKLIIPFGDQLWFRSPRVKLSGTTNHDNHVIQDVLVPLHKVSDALEFAHRELEVYPVWLCPHRLYKLPVKTMVHPEPGFEQHRRKAQMFTDVGFYYAPASASVLRGEEFNGAEAVCRLEQWLIRNHGYQAQYAVSELSEDFWRMFDPSHYEHCRRKYGAVGTFMSAHYKSKKGRKSEEEVLEAEAAILEAADADAE
ncbi:unnamed protein product [Miscanthus lutarioriparius]|uniref:Delta(24)-sterol reductase n=1 Tax=Miscanthus lutarioriparius TaxID=422564 RepID=A0A811PX17_9POAL|nr:unnamed protein product [Miscanthus lutarioriparius]